MAAQDITIIIYNIALVPIIFFSVLFILFTAINLTLKKEKIEPKKTKAKNTELPFVSVQIPSFNDPLAARCVEYCMKFDYPRNKYEIVIVDDSTSKETQTQLKAYAKKHKGFIKYIHRVDRSGFKPGALNNASPQTKGDIIVVFDSDWEPAKDYLKTIVKPFMEDPKVALVQARQDLSNTGTNLITRFAAYTLMIYHRIVMPIHNKANTVFFCGTAGALRRSAFNEVGGWNAASITEDSELTVRLLLKGYKTKYVNYGVPSEVPDAWESFIKQQMRWCYGNTRVFLDNWKTILFSRKLKVRQRAMIGYVTLGNLSAPFVVCMTFFGFAGWFLGEPTLFQWSEVTTFILRFMYTAGFFLIGGVTLYKAKSFKEFPQLLLSAFTVGIVLSVTNSYAFFKALFNRDLHWFCTPKVGNKKYVN